MLLRPIEKTGALLLELVGVNRMIVGPLLAGSGAKVVWLLLRVAKKKRYKYFTRANLP